MKIILWEGAHSPFSNSIREHLRSFKNENLYHLIESEENLNQSSPNFIISDNFQRLCDLGFQFPSAQQIYLCEEEGFWSSLKAGVRPHNRFYFLLQNQTLKDFQDILIKSQILAHEKKEPEEKNKNKAHGSLPAMKNSLGVLKKINDDQILQLEQFSKQEEERQKKFHSLIHLARSLSMSRDIEEVVQCLWMNLRSIKGVKEISFFIEHKKQAFQQIVSRAGKFHFESTSVQTPHQREFLKNLFQSAFNKGLTVLNSTQTEAISFLQKKSLKNLYCYSLFQEESKTPFLLLVEINEKCPLSPDFESRLQEQLSFIKLTLEKYLLQEEVQSRTNLWASTFDDLNDPLAIVSEKQKIIRSNQNFTALLEENPDADFLWNLLSPSSNNSSPADVSILNKIYSCRCFPIYNVESHSSGAYIAHFVDITSEHVLYNQLLQSEKMMAVGQLAGDLTSALTQPLQQIHQQATQGLLLENLSLQTQNDLKEIHKASLRSLRIITDFTYFSKGKVEKTLIDAETIVEKTIPLIKALIHGHRFHLHLSQKRHRVLASVSLLQQVLYNLLKNAHQSITTSGAITLSTESSTLNEVNGVQISVVDSGCGVPEKLREQLFQPLISTKGKDGTGLGLNIVKQIIENHQGLVGYEPQQETGSKFWIWLPLADPAV